MSERLFALLIHDHSETFEALRLALRNLSVETYSAATCRAAGNLISQCKPQVIFAERRVIDGSWQTLQGMAEDAAAPLSVIVVGAFPDTQVYISVMERGAFDFVAPPFEGERLNFIVRSAALHTQRLRQSLTQPAVSYSR